MRFDSSSAHRTRRRRSRLALVLLAALALAFLAAGAFRVGPAPSVHVRPEPTVLGRTTATEIRVVEPRRGLSRVVVELEQAGQVETLVDERFPALPGWKLWGERTPEWNWSVALGRDAHPALREGEATVRVRATPAPGWLRAGTAVLWERTVPVRLTPPSLEILSSQHYPTQGGCEAVVYRVGATSVRDGVEVGDWFFPGWPLPGGDPRDRFALFAVPYDVADDAAVRLVTSDDAGNLRSASFVDRLAPRPPLEERIELDRRFLERVVPEILASTPELRDRSDLLENFLQINRDLRHANNSKLRELAARSRPEQLWRGAFLALPGGQVMSAFAARRTYFYLGREVDRQVHLGFDLASTRRTLVPAGNRGVVVFAGDLGIYGNTVVVDHGYGLMSLYSHLSEIAVREGLIVDRAHPLGRSGMTGLAGGDHLHFTFLLQGLPVRPTEWWDAGWIRDRIQRKLGDALTF
jgi:murein DD-endopeptidase MepM/ murein hydrolase activator NlpD